MNRCLHVLAWFGFIVGLGSSVSSRDLSLIRIDNPEKVTIATRLCGYAYARTGEQYLVYLNSEIIDSLLTYKIGVKSVMSDADIQSLSLLRSNPKGESPKKDLSSLRDAVKIDEDLYVAREKASEVTDNAVLAISLEDRHIYFSFNPPINGIPNLLLDSYPTDTLVDLISQDSLYAYTKRLEDFYNRHSYGDSIAKARDWIEAKFKSFGYTDVTTPPVYYNGYNLNNVQAVKLGYAEPDKVIVIGGHYDSGNPTNNLPSFPGADDDASGVALALELARVLKDVPLRKTIVFIAFYS